MTLAFKIALPILAIAAIGTAGFAWYAYKSSPMEMNSQSISAGPEAASTDICRLSSCWGHLGCDYLVCTRTDGSTYNQSVPGDKPFDPSDYVQKIEMPVSPDK